MNIEQYDSVTLKLTQAQAILALIGQAASAEADNREQVRTAAYLIDDLLRDVCVIVATTELIETRHG